VFVSFAWISKEPLLLVLFSVIIIIIIFSFIGPKRKSSKKLGVYWNFFSSVYLNIFESNQQFFL
jgi:hypothetical protein